MRIALGIEYDGSRYFGWQRQREVISVQAELEKALSRIANHPVSIQCAGRTDAGVHGLMQVVHFDTDIQRDPYSWVRGTNRFLPDDIAVNDAVLEALGAFGCGILSEESGTTGNVPALLSDLGNSIVIVVDPLDGSTNASRGIPWYATSLCAVDQHGPRVSLVANLAPPHTEYVAIRGQGAWRNGALFTTRSHRPNGPRPLQDAVVGISGPPPASPGWWQFRALGAAALDLCLVAEGSLDAYMDCDTHGVWDYLGALLICHEAGATIVDAFGRELAHLIHGERRTPVAATSAELAQQLAALRTSIA